MQHRIFIVISVFYIWANTFAQEIQQLFPVKEIVLKQKFFINQTQPVLFNDNMMQFLTISKNDVESVTINQGDHLVNDKSNIPLECKAASGGNMSLITSYLYGENIYYSACEKGILKFNIKSSQFEYIKVADGKNISGIAQVAAEKVILLTQQGEVVFFDLEKQTIEKIIKIKGDFEFRYVVYVEGEIYATAYHPGLKQVNIVYINQRTGYARVLHDTDLTNEILAFKNKIVSVSNFILNILRVIDLNSELSQYYQLKVSRNNLRCIVKASNIFQDQLYTTSICEGDQVIFSRFNIPGEDR